MSSGVSVLCPAYQNVIQQDSVYIYYVARTHQLTRDIHAMSSGVSTLCPAYSSVLQKDSVYIYYDFMCTNKIITFPGESIPTNENCSIQFPIQFPI
jgi:hypothetical protein